MKKIITFRVYNTSILATQKYGEKQQRHKPQNQSILGAYKYGINNLDTKGRKKNDKQNIKKNKYF